jgi:DNA-binding response OmpR family regulator
MARLVFLTDRSPGQVLPSLDSLPVDAKAEPLSSSSFAHLPDLAPDVVVVDACENPPHAFAVLTALAEADTGVPVIVVCEREHLERHDWPEVAHEVLTPGAPPAEVRVRLELLRRRFGGGSDAIVRLGPVVLNTDTYQVTVDGRVLDLTYKEFELLRFLASRRGRVFTRTMLLREVWGYDFYGGTRTVDVHVRRLRAKLGPAHEHLIETVRGVGYRSSDTV